MDFAFGVISLKLVDTLLQQCFYLESRYYTNLELEKTLPTFSALKPQKLEVMEGDPLPHLFKQLMHMTGLKKADGPSSSACSSPKTERSSEEV